MCRLGDMHACKPLAMALLLAGCHPAMTPITAAALGEAASVTVFGRGSFDMVYSAASGRDCSIVHLDRGDSYCKPREKPPEPPPFCARTLGVADCYAWPEFLPDHPAPVADAPALTKEQLKNINQRWGF
jgi:hypothetical protein